MFVSYSSLCLVVILLSCYCEAGIIKRKSKPDNRIEAITLTGDNHIYNTNNRLKRSTSDPVYTQSLLNDNNPNGLVYYSGNDSKVVFVLTYRVTDGQIASSNVYRSSDYGYTFTNINNNVGGGATLASRIFLSPEDPKRVYFADANTAKLYLSVNEGINFTARTLIPNTINPLSLLQHPTVEDWVLGHDSINNILYVSRDFGKTPFKKIDNNVNSIQDYQWGESPYDTDKSIIYYNTDSINGETQVDLYTQRYHYDVTTRQEFDPSLGPHDAFIIVDRYIFAQKTIDSAITLWVSTDRKSFHQAMIPSNYEHFNYYVDSIRSIQAFVVVQHSNNQYNLYLSEEQGILYYLALSDLLVDQSVGAYDIETIDSMNYTTFIANQNVRATPDDQSPVVRTLISFDVGANWNVLNPPVTTDTECIQPLCSLHLHMSTSEYWRTGIYSQESAPGIIIAHGVTGQYLNDDNTNLFISRDGGSTWSMTLTGTWGVSILDRGSLIIAAHDYHNTDESNSIMYTCNEGITWTAFTFSNDQITIFAVITEPGETTTVASLYGIGSSSWIIVTVNFTNVFPRQCGNNDYYNWTRFDQNTDTGCLLGSMVTIERQKPASCCLNGKNYNSVISFTTCACSEEDFECDYGYKHANGYDGDCVRDDSVTLSNPCGVGDTTYMATQGYHKIGGDVCSGGVESSYVAMETSCCYFDNSNGSTSNGTAIILGCIILLSFIVITILAVFFIVCLVKLNKSRNTGGTRGYRVVPPTYQADDIPINDDDQSYDNDDRPLVP